MSLFERIEATWDRGLAYARKRSRLFDHVWCALVRFTDVSAGQLAAAISYYGFFAVFALAAVAYSVLGSSIGTNSGVFAAVNRYLRDTLPSVAETAKDFGTAPVTLIGSVALVLAGVGWIETLRASQRAIWLLDQHPGQWLLRRIVDLGMLVGLGLLSLLSLVMTGVLDRLLNWAAGPNPDGLTSTLLGSSGTALEFVVNFVLAAAMLTAVPRLRLSPRRLLPATLVTAAGIQLLNSIGRLYVEATTGRPAYQVVAAAAGLLVYLYLLNQVILFGAALAATADTGRMVDLAASREADSDLTDLSSSGLAD